MTVKISVSAKTLSWLYIVYLRVILLGCRNSWFRTNDVSGLSNDYTYRIADFQLLLLWLRSNFTSIKFIVMKTYLLPPYPLDGLRGKSEVSLSNNRTKVESTSNRVVNPVKKKALPKTTWFPADTPENLSDKEAIIRLFLVVILPGISAAIAWNYNIYFIIPLVPIMFYLEITAFTLTCPIKKLFSNYQHPSKYE